jgi:hypothetical protein
MWRKNPSLKEVVLRHVTDPIQALRNSPTKTLSLLIDVLNKAQNYFCIIRTVPDFITHVEVTYPRVATAVTTRSCANSSIF